MYSLFDASVGTEELNHIEMVCTIVHQLTRNLTVQQIKEQGFADYYVDHTVGIWPQSAGGVPCHRRRAAARAERHEGAACE